MTSDQYEISTFKLKSLENHFMKNDEYFLPSGTNLIYECICHGYFVKYDNYIYSPANIYNVHAISQYMKLTLWHHTINTALALDKFLIKAPPPHAH